MIHTRQDLKYYLREDAARNGITYGWISYYMHLLCGSENAHVFRYLKCLRRCEYHYNRRPGILRTILYGYYRFRFGRLGLKYNIRIPLNTCGYGLRIMHLAGGGGILLNCNRMGNYCGINSGVLLGNKDAEDARPTVGDYVAFGPGSKAIGRITIGDHVFVAANAVVVKDIPDHCVVAGVPAKILRGGAATAAPNLLSSISENR